MVPILRRFLLLASATGGMMLVPSRGETAPETYPSYARPAQSYSGVLRIYGADLKGLLQRWAEGYERMNPDTHVAINPNGSDAAMGALEQGTADVAVLGRELELNEYLGFYETCGFNPTEITVASGTLDVPGASWAPVIFVNRTNPIGQLTLGQLDGIFGAQRSGAYRGFRWSPELARSAAQNLRTWGQVGLTGQWADQPIHTYGYATGGMAHFFEAKVFSGGTKWNENYHEYIENGTKIMAAGAESGGILSMLATLEHDPLGIGWAGFPQWKQVPQVSGIKVVALALKAGGPFVYPTKTTLADRSYPLTRSIYLVLAKEPGGTLSPKVKDFVRYVLSAEGQAAVREQGVYFALPAALAAQEAGKLE